MKKKFLLSSSQVNFIIYQFGSQVSGITSIYIQTTIELEDE
jgi:hypothetical protein